MDIFEPNEGESLDKRYGEIFLTTKGNLTIQCSVCDMIYKNYETYSVHLYENHLKFTSTFENSSDLDKKPDFSRVDTTTMDLIETEPLIGIKMESLENEILKEEELPIDSLIEITRDENEKEFLSDNEGNISSIEMPNLELSLPILTRKSKKVAQRKKESNRKVKVKRKIISKQEKPVCLECKKGYNTTINNMYHTCEKRFLCSYCGHSFTKNSHLKRHIKSHTNRRDYKCKICDKGFYRNDVLKRHMMGHSTERPFACNTCTATFSRKSALRNHSKLHENKLEYKCKLCDRAFNQQAGVVSHMKVVHRTT